MSETREQYDRRMASEWERAQRLDLTDAELAELHRRAASNAPRISLDDAVRELGIEESGDEQR